MVTSADMSEQLGRIQKSADPVEWTRIALKGMCLEARELYPTAKYCLLVDSDQGEYADWVSVEDADGVALEDWPEDDNEWGGNLWDTARREMQVYTDTPYDKRNPWQGVRIDIDKVLGTEEQR